MRRRMVIKDVGRNFLRCPGTNFLLICQFTICFFLLITMMTYYFDVGDSNEFNTVCRVNDRAWYMLRMDTGSSGVEFSEIALAPDGLERVSSLYRRLQENPGFDLISAREWQNIYLETSLMESRFGKNQFDQLIHDNDGILDLEQCYVEVNEGNQMRSLVSLKSVQMNEGAYQAFGLRTVEGAGFTAENTTLHSAEDPIPVILGNDYQGYFDVGDMFWFALPTMGSEDWGFQGVVVGILDDASIMPVYGGGEGNPEKNKVNLDETILVAVGLKLETLPEHMDQRAKYASAVYADALDNSYLSPCGNAGYQTAVKAANEISREYGIKLMFTSVSFGMEMLLEESKASMTILLILTGSMAVFTVFCLASVCVTRMRDRAAEYAICMMNGARTGDLLLPCLIEFAILLLPSLLLNFMFLRHNMTVNRNDTPFVLILVMAGVVFLFAAVIMVKRIGGISIEQYMRRMET